jgi:hypothetical protein
MRTRVMICATLLALAGTLPVWASSSPQPMPPIQEQAIESPSMNAPRQKPVKPEAPSRGQLLYENHCMVCHESVVHIRSQQHVQSLPALQSQVLHWAAYMKLRWGKEETEEVVSHLNDRYYKFGSR